MTFHLLKTILGWWFVGLGALGAIWLLYCWVFHKLAVWRYERHRRRRGGMVDLQGWQR